MRHPEAVVVAQGIACDGVKRNGLLVAAGKVPTVGDRKRGAVGARVDFLDVVKIGGQIRAKCLCYN